jgi:putative endonuclease
MNLPRWLRAWLRPRLGARGERRAASLLRRAGYRVLAANLRTNLGEIDLLAEAPDGREIVVVEVKTGTSSSPELRPELHVNRAKQRKLAALAAQLAARRGFHDRPIRFDVIGVDLPPGGQPVVRHHVGAFESYL